MRSFSRAQQIILLAISLGVLLASLPRPLDGRKPPPRQQWAVEVAGGIREPGIYTFSHSPTAGQVIEKAGGMLANSSISHITRSNTLQSGARIEARAIGPASVKLLLSRMDVTKRLVLGVPIDVNEAGVDELAAVPGISLSLARRIVGFRESYGPFRTWNDLKCVKGVGPKNVERFQSYLSLT